jgi:hypothetical protein
MKFNTEGLRRRMRDQQGNFASKGKLQGNIASKGKLLSSAPIRVPTRAEELDKENVGPNTSATNNFKMKKRPEPLTISVTMSEGDVDNLTPEEPTPALSWSRDCRAE